MNKKLLSILLFAFLFSESYAATVCLYAGCTNDGTQVHFVVPTLAVYLDITLFDANKSIGWVDAFWDYNASSTPDIYLTITRLKTDENLLADANMADKNYLFAQWNYGNKFYAGERYKFTLRATMGALEDVNQQTITTESGDTLLIPLSQANEIFGFLAFAGLALFLIYYFTKRRQ